MTYVEFMISCIYALYVTLEALEVQPLLVLPSPNSDLLLILLFLPYFLYNPNYYQLNFMILLGNRRKRRMECYSPVEQKNMAKSISS